MNQLKPVISVIKEKCVNCHKNEKYTSESVKGVHFFCMWEGVLF